MAKQPNLINITSGYASNTALNSNFEALRNALLNTLSRDGSTPNAMNADLDMNGNEIVNASGLQIEGTDVFTLINKTTISTLAPSGGEDGDVWFRVSS
jgi:hypothetical protein